MCGIFTQNVLTIVANVSCLRDILYNSHACIRVNITRRFVRSTKNSLVRFTILTLYIYMHV